MPDEAGARRFPALWRRGGFPRSLLALSEADSLTWRRQFVQTYVERDIPQLGISIPAPTLLRFWTMVAHYHGGVWNSAEAARSMGVSEPTARRYLDLLSSLFLVRQLQPWHENLKKRQVKAPKAYVRDCGLLHALLGVGSERELAAHPKAGASWEGAVIEWALDVLQPESAYFWATHQGAELDLLVVRAGRRYGIEVKRQDAPSLTPSMRIALADLRLEHLAVVYPGDEPYALAPNVSVVPAASLITRDTASLLGRPQPRRSGRVVSRSPRAATE
jgi:predicted AAA+ superfamily ATPase